MTKLRLRKFYARNKYRDNDDNSVFKTIYKNLSFFSNTGYLILLAPTVLISSLFTQAAFLMFANIFLALGFVFNFCHRMYLQEVSYFELLMTAAIIAGLILFAFYLTPIVPGTTLISILCFTNLFSSSINSFFLIRNIVIPPLASFTKWFLTQLGYPVSINYFDIHSLEIERDRVVIDRLMKKYYKYDTYDTAYKSDDLKPFNQIIRLVCRYINKYQEPFLGYINHHDQIKKLEEAVSKLVKEGDAESSYTFIHKKISFKESKIKELKRITSLIKQTEIQDFTRQKMIPFFKYFQHSDEQNPNSKESCLGLLTKEIARQERKLQRLCACDIPRPHL